MFYYDDIIVSRYTYQLFIRRRHRVNIILCKLIILHYSGTPRAYTLVYTRNIYNIVYIFRCVMCGWVVVGGCACFAVCNRGWIGAGIIHNNTIILLYRYQPPRDIAGRRQQSENRDPCFCA